MIYAPKTLSNLYELLDKKDDKTYIIAGGTDLIIKLKNKKVVDYNIIDLSKIEDFKGFREDEKNFYIGSIVTMTEMLNEYRVVNHYRALYQAAYKLGSNQIRNLATIGGNVANASQSADCLLALYALDAKVNLLNSNGYENIISIEDFIIGKENTILKNNEVIKEIIIEKKSSLNMFEKIGSRTGVTISKISCAMNFILDEEKIKDIRIFLGGVGVKPVRAKKIEDVMNTVKFRNIDSEKLQIAGYYEIENAIPNRKSRFYKREAIKGLLEDMLEELIKYER